MSHEKEYHSLKEFYPFYLGEHSKRGTRISHFVGTLFFFGFLGATIATGILWFLIPMIAATYAAAWVGHFFIEHNTPATFKYPLWSAASDFMMFFGMIAGRQSWGE